MKLNKYLFNSVESTNDTAIKKIKEGLSSGIIVAKKQTRGRIQTRRKLTIWRDIRMRSGERKYKHRRNEERENIGEQR